MSVIEIYRQFWEFERARTLATLDAVTQLRNPYHALGWRPGPGRAHVAWQLMHVGITEELFATERLKGTKPGWPTLVPRFKGGSTPDDDIPSIDQLRDVLTSSREHLLSTAATFTDADLETIPPAFKERGWTVGRILQVIAWHEAHHQGQAHITLNLYKAAHP
jgi:uncharacterized damage-inducible protein DinB